MANLDAVALTSRWMAAARAVESRRPDRLFDDPFAEALAGDEGFAMLAAMDEATRLPGSLPRRPNPYAAIRTRYIDDVLRDRLSRGDVDRVVMPAAGLDVRAFRLPAIAAAHVWELDRAEVLRLKDATLAALGAAPLCARTALGTDLRDDWSAVLTGAGFEPRWPSVWVAEGLLNYLDAAEAGRLLAACAALASPGSTLIADMIGASFFGCAAVQPLLRALAERDAPWRFGDDDPEPFFAARGWAADVVRIGESRANYSRWPYPVPPRGTPGVPQSFVVTATRI